MVTSNAIVINFKGGIISPGYLKEVLLLAKEARVENLRFGLRQQLLLDIPLKYFPDFANACKEKGILFYNKKEALPNIVSSYPADGIFTSNSWLKEGVYKDIFDLFDYEPQLKINICDKNQRFVLFFTGHLNWVSSPTAHFWYLYIRFPHSRAIYCWPELIYTNDIANLSKVLEKLILNPTNEEANGSIFYQIIKRNKKSHYTTKAIEEQLSIPKFSLSYYEGFNKSESSYWLGIYRRDELFSLKFLLEACEICLATRVGEIYTTSWKSLIIKGIDPGQRHYWDFILGKFRINVRHAANELNWQIEDNKEALILKRIIIRYFDKEDVRTFGLCFAIQTKPLFNMFASIVIRKSNLKNLNRLKSLDRYDILYENNFNPNGAGLTLFREKVEKNFIGPYLVSLCKMFYERESEGNLLTEDNTQTAYSKQPLQEEKYIHQCKHCLTVYDETEENTSGESYIGKSFEELPQNYTCPLCDSGKGDFIRIKQEQLEFVEIDSK